MFTPPVPPRVFELLTCCTSWAMPGLPPVPVEAVTVKVMAGLVMPPEVAEICVVPAATAVAVPVLEPTVAMLEFDEDHTALAVKFWVLLSL